MELLAGLLGILLLLLVLYSLFQWRAQSTLRADSRRLASGQLKELSPSSMPFLAEIVSALNSALKQARDIASSSAEERDLLTSATEAASDGIIAVSHGGVVALANPAARQLLRPSSIRPGMPIAQAVRDHEIVSLFQHALATAQVERLSLDYGPERRRVQVVVNPLPPGGAWAALLVIHDLSDQRRIERTRREFITNVSHELRTPLASIRAAVETLEDGALEDAEAAPSFLSSIRDEVERMTQMVEELLELSRIESGALPLEARPIDIHDVAQRAVARVEGQSVRKGLQIHVEAPAQPASVNGDSARLEQALVNLLHNAVKFTDQGGIEVLVAVEEDQVVVAVNDSGVGVARSDLPHIFERFYKADRARSSEGAGLGLAIVKHTVQAHGGSVWAESQLERGSTFSFSLPRADSAS